MLTRILEGIQAHKVPCHLLIIFLLRKRELRIYQPDRVLAGFRQRLEAVGTLQLEIHNPPVDQFLEDCYELKGDTAAAVALGDDLDSRAAGFHALVDGDHITAVGDGEDCGETGVCQRFGICQGYLS